jgi:hypothetical protein
MPFGIEMSTPLTAFEAARLKIITQRIPKPHPLLDTYEISYDPAGSIHEIVAVSAPISDASIALIRFKSLIKDLRSRYGLESFSDDDEDEVVEDGLWTELMFFRTDLTKTWFAAEGAPLDADVAMVAAMVDPLRNGEYGFRVRYLAANRADHAKSL